MKMFQRLVAIGVFTLPASLMNAEQIHYLHAHVPFTFIIAGRQFAPGDYMIQESDTGVLLVEGRGEAVFALSSPAAIGRETGKPELIFAKKQQQEYLVGVDTDGRHDTRAIPLRWEEVAK